LSDRKSVGSLAARGATTLGFVCERFSDWKAIVITQAISWFEAKTAIIREAVCTHIANPLYSLSQLRNF